MFGLGIVVLLPSTLLLLPPSEMAGLRAEGRLEHASELARVRTFARYLRGVSSRVLRGIPSAAVAELAPLLDLRVSELGPTTVKVKQSALKSSPSFFFHTRPAQKLRSETLCPCPLRLRSSGPPPISHVRVY